VESIDFTSQMLHIRAPEFDPATVTSIHAGGVKVDGEREGPRKN
jgi:hypothetical protein